MNESPDSSSLSYNFRKQLGDNSPLDIIDLRPQLPSNFQLFITGPATLLPEVVQREKKL